MPRVIVLNQAAVPLGMAGGTRHVELFERLEGWDVTILAGNRSYLDQQPVASAGILKAVRVTRFRGNGASRVLNWVSYMAAAFVAALRGPRPAIVWGSSPQMGAAVVGLLVAKLRRARFILEVRDLWPHILVEAGMIRGGGLVHRVIRSLEELLYRSADRIVVLAEGTGREIARRGFDDGKVFFLPNGADVDSFVVAEDRASLRAELGFDGFVIIYAGAHGPANGLAQVIDAAAILASHDSPCRFVLVGDGIEKPKLQAKVAARGLANVTFLDPVPKSAIARLYAGADAGLHSLADVDLFKYGVSPNKLYDYMAAGLPVITNAGGDVADMVAQADSGVAVEPGEIAAGAAVLASSSAEQRSSWGQNGRAFMRNHRSRAALADQLESMLDAVAADQR